MLSYFLFNNLLTTIREFIHSPLTLEISDGGFNKNSEAVSNFALRLHLILS